MRRRRPQVGAAGMVAPGRVHEQYVRQRRQASHRTFQQRALAQLEQSRRVGRRRHAVRHAAPAAKRPPPTRDPAGQRPFGRCKDARPRRKTPMTSRLLTAHMQAEFWLRFDETLADRVADKHRAVVEVQFLHDVCPVRLDRLDADGQLL
jgi:hypothetical protein